MEERTGSFASQNHPPPTFGPRRGHDVQDFRTEQLPGGGPAAVQEEERVAVDLVRGGEDMVLGADHRGRLDGLLLLLLLLEEEKLLLLLGGWLAHDQTDVATANAGPAVGGPSAGPSGAGTENTPIANVKDGLYDDGSHNSLAICMLRAFDRNF